MTLPFSKIIRRFGTQVARIIRKQIKMETQNLTKVEILLSPIQSESDPKTYRTIRLENGLTALLIADQISDREDAEKNAKLAACSLSIDVGYFSDPQDIQGLSHFLEHMIFMGSTKYPSENEYRQYISMAGGYSNAETMAETTKFYFSAGKNQLEGAIDRFSNLFKNPLLLKETMTRERDAVESEFAMNSLSQYARLEQLLASMGQPDHPSRIFGWGNSKTLKEGITDDDLYERVHEFRRRHYSAHRMYLCVQACMDLDDLQELVVKHWWDIPNNQLPGNDFSSFNHLNAFNANFSSKLVLSKSISNDTKLELNFCLPSVIKDYKSSPHLFVANLLNDEASGSLCAYLREKLYITKMKTAIQNVNFTSNRLFALFKICVNLTQLGMNNTYDVLAAIFGYIRFLRNAGPQETLFREMQQIDATKFRFQTELTPLDNVENLSNQMVYYPPEDLITSESLFSEYDPIGISKILDALTDPAVPLNVMLISHNSFNGQQFDLEEPWFRSKYAMIDVPIKWKELRTSAPILDGFRLPSLNPYIATDFTILYNEDVTKKTDYPVKIYESTVGKLWFRQDDRFLLPTAYCYICLSSPITRGTVDNYTNAELLTSLLEFKLKERLYPATVAGLDYHIFNKNQGITIIVHGYNQKLHLIVEEIATVLTNFADHLTEQQFRTIVEQKLRDFYNRILKSKNFYKDLQMGILDSTYVPKVKAFEHLKTHSLTSFRTFARNFTRKLRIQALFQGNLTDTQAVSIMTNLVDTIKCSALDDPSLLELRTNRLPSGANYLRCRNMNRSDVNTVTVNYYQFGQKSIRSLCLTNLLMHTIKEPTFDQLRNREQLGYDVNSDTLEIFGILGFVISVASQEIKFTAEHIDDRIEAFRSEIARILSAISEPDFEQFKQSLINRKLKADNSLYEEVRQNWHEIVSSEYMFDRHLREVECLRTITKVELIEFYSNHFKDSRKLCVQVIGNADLKDGVELETVTSIFEKSLEPSVEFVEFSDGHERGHLIQDVGAFLKTLEAYPSVTETM